jgi:hypothetical protein
MDIQASAPDYEKRHAAPVQQRGPAQRVHDPDAKGIVFLGEFPNADPATAKLLQKYVNGEDMSGVLRKPDGVMVVADGNRLEDKSSVQQQGRALISRFEQHEVYADAQDNMDFASARLAPHGADVLQGTSGPDRQLRRGVRDLAGPTRHQRSNVQDQMSEEGKLGIWANMRSWERISAKEYVADQLKSPLTWPS